MPGSMPSSSLWERSVGDNSGQHKTTSSVVWSEMESEPLARDGIEACGEFIRDG